METWDFAHCLPYFRKMETALAAAPDDPWRGHDGPLVVERGPATNPLFGAFFASAQQAGYPLTDDVNGYRQEGFAPFDRNIHRGRRLSAARAYLHPILRHRSNLSVWTRRFVTRDRVRRVAGGRGRGRPRQRRAWRRRSLRRRRGDPRRRCDQQPAAAAAVGDRARRPAPRARHPRSSRTGRGSGENLQDHLEVYVQHQSARPVSMQPQRRSAGGDRSSVRSGCSCAPGRGRRTTSRAAGSSARTTTSPTPT